MLIIDMPMQKGYCELSYEILGVWYCPIKDRVCNFFRTKERPDWCPIKGEIADEHSDQTQIKFECVEWFCADGKRKDAEGCLHGENTCMGGERKSND